MEQTSQTIHFQIKGELVTNLAREKYYQCGDLKAALDILKGSLQTDQLTPNQITMLALQILNYDADIVGTYPGDSYGVAFRDDVDENNCDMEKILSLQTQISERNEAAHSNYNELLRKYLFICEQLPDYELTDLNADYYNETGEFLFPELDTPAWKLAKRNNENIANANTSPMLESFLQQQTRERENLTTKDYGWLDPDGNFYPVDWCEHDTWARNYLDKNFPFNKTYAHMYWRTDENGERRHIVNGDVMIYTLHWVLLHSPYRGLPIAEYDNLRTLTKAQKEFLYDFYIERGRHDDANALYKDD